MGIRRRLPLNPRTNLMQKAIYYARNNWGKLTAFLDHPVMPLDNNPIERAIRPFTLGRRNWLFSGSPKGASASAFIYSLVETAKANGWEPRAYLQTLFEKYPEAKNDEERRALLPMNLEPEVEAR
ncbi:MAG TPA: transposase [Arenicellales bacterium]|nr:transposase [Arenicellales bacterium]